METGSSVSELLWTAVAANHIDIDCNLLKQTELPANLYLKKIGPHIFLPTIVTIWGIITTLQGFVTSYRGLIATRVFLGLVEGEFFSGIVLYLSTCYTRRELQLRIALFFSAASLSGAFSGLLAYGLIRLDGAGGRPGWAWIFIVEGLFTVLCGICGYFIIPATPTATRFLNARQKESLMVPEEIYFAFRIILKRLERDQPLTEIDEQFRWCEVWASLKSPHVLINAVTLFVSGTSLYSLAYFQPTSCLGYDSQRTQLMSVPPFAVAFLFMLSTAYVSDRFEARGATTCGGAILALKYASLFLSVPGVYSIPPSLAAWQSNNSFGHYRKAVSIAIGFVAANAGGILSTWLFPQSDRPQFRKATIINITFSIATIFFTILNLCWLCYSNARKRSGRSKLLNGYQLNTSEAEINSTESIRAWKELGDQHPDFNYAY
ncbi:major facilitator superfamily domain-containing protein [Melampsora americana]|nr:major facilitator superfamily domain-containing protein [Melampsora americana]